ncbi:TetR family transcriptional regulator [Bradyrhizobium sp. CB82]|uniref:TetR family transcriptional regulator n=1 Tax=Bradyrhizobium sp. CB82 TaxID=3039159 RepID=UPI0024B1A0B6|nr:TetR family transcriptional regulator [Bradyrhizobium sp. CB82]WFU42896.1 TetR family transcriptional regulator [Bradyrhizobium sp. CB82]
MTTQPADGRDNEGKASSETDSTQRAVEPRERAPERRRKELIDSALLEFSTKGFGGARTDSIIARTNSNKAMLFHYFGSKEGLYIAVLEQVYADIRDSEAAIDFDALPPRDAIIRLIEFTFDYYIANPAFVRMINNENLHEAAHLRKSNHISKVNTSIIAKLQRILDRGVRDGQFRPGIDATDLYISISALGFTYVSNRHTLSIVFDRDLFAEETLKDRLKNMTEMVLRYLSR